MGVAPMTRTRSARPSFQPAYGRCGVGQVLQQRALLHIDVVRQLEQASLGGRGILRQPSVQREAEGLEALAVVGASGAAGRAHPAQDVRMDGDAVPGPGILDALPALLDHAGELVPRYEREPHVGQHPAADAQVVVAEPGTLHPEHHLAVAGPGLRAIGKAVLTGSGGVEGFHREPLRAASSWRGATIAWTRGLALPANVPMGLKTALLDCASRATFWSVAGTAANLRAM